MSGEGRPTELDVDGGGLRIAVVAGTWHERITEGLLAGALRT
ncbi:6,7-dimethyl-8-ribityllumazine synthase, partial [Schumannella luteola]